MLATPGQNIKAFCELWVWVAQRMLEHKEAELTSLQEQAVKYREKWEQSEEVRARLKADLDATKEALQACEQAVRDAQECSTRVLSLEEEVAVLRVRLSETEDYCNIQVEKAEQRCAAKLGEYELDMDQCKAHCEEKLEKANHRFVGESHVYPLLITLI